MYDFDLQEPTVDDLVDAIRQRIERQSMPLISELQIAWRLLRAYMLEPADARTVARSLILQMAMDVADPLAQLPADCPAVLPEDSDRDALVLLRFETIQSGTELRRAFDTARKVYAEQDSLQLVILAEAMLARGALAAYSLSEGELRLDGRVMPEASRSDGHIAFLEDLLELHRILCDMNEIARGETDMPTTPLERMRYLQETRNAFRFLADHLGEFAGWCPMLTNEHCLDAIPHAPEFANLLRERLEVISA